MALRTFVSFDRSGAGRWPTAKSRPILSKAELKVNEEFKAWPSLLDLPPRSIVWRGSHGSLNRMEKMFLDPTGHRRSDVIRKTNLPPGLPLACAAAAPGRCGKLSLANGRVGVTAGKTVTGWIQEFDAPRTAGRML